MLLFLNDPATTEIYTLSLHDALPIFQELEHEGVEHAAVLHEDLPRLVVRALDQAAHLLVDDLGDALGVVALVADRSEEHTSELQSRQYLVCSLLLEKTTQHRHSNHLF